MLTALLALGSIVILMILTIHEIFNILDNHEKEMNELRQNMRVYHDYDIIETRKHRDSKEQVS